MTTDLRTALREAAALLREDAQDHIDDARKQAATVAESDAAKDRDAAKWRKVEPLIERLRVAADEDTSDTIHVVDAAIELLAAAKEPS